MIEVLNVLGIRPPRKDSSARWAIGASLRSVDVLFSDMGGSRLQGYGQLSEDAADLMETLSRELRQATQEGVLLLQEQPRPIK